MVKDHPFPSSGEYGQSFIIDIRPISYYSLLHKWLSPAWGSQTYNSIQIITENHIQNQLSVKMNTFTIQENLGNDWFCSVYAG